MICSDCGHDCDTTEVDNGYGLTEYWGHSSVHVATATVSACCEAPIVSGESRVIRQSTHVARKDHGTIRQGQRYRLTVTRHYRSGGPSWITTQKRAV